MKRIISNVMLVAAAAMAFFACQKQEVNAPEEVKVEGLNFSADKPEFADASKTEWTGSEIHWSKGDAIRVAYTCNGVWQNADGTATADEVDGKKTAKLYASTSLAEASATAKFAVPGKFKGEASGIYEFYAIYPSGAAVNDTEFPFAPSVTVDIPAEQTPLANSFDSAADLMAAKSVKTFEGLPTESISLLWTRIVAHGHLTIKNLQVEDGEKLQTITLTADKDADMVGEHYLYLDTHDVEKAAGNNAANSLTVKANNLTIAEGEEGGDVTFWACFLPCTWKSLDVVVETDKATYTRSIDLTGKEKTFKQNARNTLGINMASAVREAKTALSLPFVRDFSDRSGSSGSSDITELDGFSSIGGKVYNADEAIRLASGSADGSITTQSLDLSQNFHVIVTACGWDSGELKMTVSAGEQTENITLTTYGADQKPGTWKDYVINFDPVGPTASVQFSAIADNRYFIQKIQILEGHAELTPVLSATTPEEMSADGGNGTFTYTLANPKDGETVSATKNVDWIGNLTVNQDNKTVSYTVAKNTAEDSREGTITLSYEGAQSVDVTVTQAGKAQDIKYYEKVTSSPADWSGTYLIVYEATPAYWDGSKTPGTSTGQMGTTSGMVNTTISDGKIQSNSTVDKSVIIIEKSGTKYSLKAASGSYMGMSTNNNGLKSSSTSSTYLHTITLESNNTVSILSSDGYTKVAYNKSSSFFRYYKVTTISGNTAGYPLPCLYRLENGESGSEESKPEITVSSDATVEVEAAGMTGTVSYTLANAVDGAKVSAEANQTWVTIGTVTSTSVPFTVSANTGGERTATIALSYDGAVSKTVNITQAAAPKPEITVSSEVSVNVEAAGMTGTVSYTLANAVDGAKVSAEANQTWVTIGTVTSTSVPFTVSANTGGERTATITLSYDGAESKTVTVKQAAAETTEPEDPEGETVEVTDVLTLAGLNVGTYNSYTSWSEKSFVSSAVYAGVSYNSNSSIQLKNGSNSGIVTTASGGTLKKIVVSWHSSTTEGRYITIYGSNTPYSSTSDLYGDKKGTSLGTIKCGTSTELVISGDYKYFGILANGALYLPEIKVIWEASASTGGETPDPTPDPTTYTYTFTSKAWADATSSWTSGKDGGQLQSGRGVQVSTTYTGANATCKTSMSNIQKVVFVYSTNASNGAGSIKVSIGNQEKTLSVTKTGGTSDRNLEFDFSASPLSGQLKFTVTCTTNSIYIKSVSITAN